MFWLNYSELPAVENAPAPRGSCVCTSFKRLLVSSLRSLANKLRRVELSTASLLKVAPAAEERKIVHSLFLNTLDTKYDQRWCLLIFAPVFWELRLLFFWLTGFGSVSVSVSVSELGRGTKVTVTSQFIAPSQRCQNTVHYSLSCSVLLGLQPVLLQTLLL